MILDFQMMGLDIVGLIVIAWAIISGILESQKAKNKRTKRQTTPRRSQTVVITKKEKPQTQTKPKPLVVEHKKPKSFIFEEPEIRKKTKIKEIREQKKEAEIISRQEKEWRTGKSLVAGNELVKAVIWSEILGPPRAKKFR